MTESPSKTALIVGGNVAPIVPQTIEETFRLAGAFSASRLAPKTLDTPEKVMVAIMAGSELGLPPFQAMQSFAVVSGRAVLWGDGFLAVLQSRGFKVEEWFDDEDEPTKAFCKVTRPDTGQEIERSFSLEDARKANLLGKEGPWQNYRKRMLQMRARGFAGRDGASDVLRGFQLAEEAQDYVEIKEVRGGRQKVDLGARLAANQEGAREGFNAAHVAEQTGGQAVDAEVEEEVSDTDEPCGECGAEAGVECAPGCSSWDDLAELPEHIAIARAAAEQAHDPDTGEVIDQEEEQSPKTQTNPNQSETISSPQASDHAGNAETHSNSTKDKTAASDTAHSEAGSTDDGFPGDNPMSGGVGDGEDRTEAPAAINAFWTEVANMTSWLSVKARIGGLYKADDWNELEPAEQAAERAKIWAFVDGVIKAKHKDPVDFAQDATVFRLWMETQTDAEGPDAVEGSLRVLQQAPAFLRQNADFQKGFVATVEDWIKARRGKKR